jgi:hypothetical protein
MTVLLPGAFPGFGGVVSLALEPCVNVLKANVKPPPDLECRAAAGTDCLSEATAVDTLLFRGGVDEP